MYINRTILLADDQSPAREEMREILRNTQCTIVGESRNTDDMLEKYQRLQPDVLIIDATLPGTLDALVAIQRIHRANPEAIILATAATSQNYLLMEALSMGAVDFILKPFQRKTVLSCLQRNAA